MTIQDQITSSQEEADKLLSGINSLQKEKDMLEIRIDTEKAKYKIVAKGIERMKEQLKTIE